MLKAPKEEASDICTHFPQNLASKKVNFNNFFLEDFGNESFIQLLQRILNLHPNLHKRDFYSKNHLNIYLEEKVPTP